MPTAAVSLVVYDPITRSYLDVDSTHPIPVTGTTGGGGGGGTSDATAANQTTGNASLSSIDGKVATAAKQDTGNTSLGTLVTSNSAIQTSNATVAGAVTSAAINSRAALPLPASATLSVYTNTATSALALVNAGTKKLLRARVANPNGTWAYLQLFNSATTAGVTLGTTAPFEVIAVPPNASISESQDFSFAYSAGIVVAATTTATGSTALTTPLVITLGYSS